jgi:hypothetical protein
MSTDACVLGLTDMTGISRHMGVTAIDSNRGDLDKIVSTLKEVIGEAKASKN